MTRTKEGLPIVTMEAVHQVAAEIRAKSSDDLLAELAKENPLVAEAIKRFVLHTVKDGKQSTVIKEMASIYGLLKCQGKLDQAGEQLFSKIS